MRRRAIVGLVLAGLLAPAGPASAHRAEPEGVLHRVVWNAEQDDGPHFRIMSADLDGSDRRLIFRRSHGFTMELTLSRDGPDVAFTVMPRRPRKPMRLLVVDVLTGERVEPLAGVRRFGYIGAVGWSPDGERLVFEGNLDQHGERHLYLWTIGLNGSGLRRITEVDRDDDGQLTNMLSWTGQGIFFIEHGDLALFSHGRTSVVMPRVWRQYLSGNGRWLYVEQLTPDRRHDHFVRLHPDGSGVERLPVAGTAVPDFSGRRLLSAGPDGLVSHPATRAPRSGDPVLDFVDGSPFTWN